MDLYISQNIVSVTINPCIFLINTYEFYFSLLRWKVYHYNNISSKYELSQLKLSINQFYNDNLLRDLRYQLQYLRKIRYLIKQPKYITSRHAVGVCNHLMELYPLPVLVIALMCALNRFAHDTHPTQCVVKQPACP